MRKFLFLVFISIVLMGSVFLWVLHNKRNPTPDTSFGDPVYSSDVGFSKNTHAQTILTKKILSGNYHVFQTFNNCGPASLSMALSYYGIHTTQEKLGNELRPFQNQQGDNDDKSVTLEELANKAAEYGFTPIHRPNGNIRLIKFFISNDIPVITKTWLKDNDDIGHYRVVKGFDDGIGELIQDDSLQGKNLRYSYFEFEEIWDKFNYEYLVLVPKEKENLVLKALGDDSDINKSWENAVEQAEKELQITPQNVSWALNLVVALYNTGKYTESVEEFEKIQHKLPKRALWYQVEPILSYYETGDFEKVFELTDNILNGGNRAYSELYLIRGNIYQKQGRYDDAKKEYEKALFYNQNMKQAKQAVEKLPATNKF